MEAQSAMRGSRTHSSPNIRQSVTTETVSTAPPIQANRLTTHLDYYLLKRGSLIIKDYY